MFWKYSLIKSLWSRLGRMILVRMKSQWTHSSKVHYL